METISLSGLDDCRALFVYEGGVRTLVTRLKYRNDRRAVGRLADGLAALLDPPPGTVVTWIPTTAARRRGRGFDQAALLARAVARRWRLPCRALLQRGAGPPQTGQTLAGRERGIDVVVRNRGSPLEVPVVLVDDVITSGASLRSGAAALRAAGVPWVGGVAIARTPRSR